MGKAWYRTEQQYVLLVTSDMLVHDLEAGHQLVFPFRRLPFLLLYFRLWLILSNLSQPSAKQPTGAALRRENSNYRQNTKTNDERASP